MAGLSEGSGGIERSWGFVRRMSPIWRAASSVSSIRSSTETPAFVWTKVLDVLGLSLRVVPARGRPLHSQARPTRVPHLVANEAFFLKAARRSGLETAEAEVVRDAEGAAGLLVHRFDRVVDYGGDVPLARPCAPVRP